MADTKLDEAVGIVRDQLLPMMRRTGGGGYADAIEVLLERERALALREHGSDERHAAPPAAQEPDKPSGPERRCAECDPERLRDSRPDFCRGCNSAERS